MSAALPWSRMLPASVLRTDDPDAAREERALAGLREENRRMERALLAVHRPDKGAIETVGDR